MIIGNVLVVYMETELKALATVKRVLKGYGVGFKAVVRTKVDLKDFKNMDLVVTLGGDGTFLRTANFVVDTPMLGVNSNPKQKEGFFMRANAKDFKKKFGTVLKNKFKILQLQRLEAKVNGKVVGLALNEFYIGSHKSYETTRYSITVGRKTELQKSSGVLVSTASGSYAWAKSAGGKKLALESKKFQVIVRDPYRGFISNYSITKKILGSKEKVKLCCHMRAKSVLVADSWYEEYRLREGDVVEIGISKYPVKLVAFKEKNKWG